MDGRLISVHGFKFAPRLQQCHDGEVPVLIRVETRAGHGAGKPTDTVIERISGPIMSSSADQYVVDSFEPAYVSLGRDELSGRVTAALEELEHCGACPRTCNVNRRENEIGRCHTGRLARVIGAFPHLGEEDCLRGWAGSGTIFVSRCNLSCVFCQNHDTSQHDAGQELSARQIADLMLQLQGRGCHNINLVTPEHVVPQMLEALVEAIAAGLRLPIVYNTSGYDSLRSLKWLDGIVDIYMPDFKFWKPETAERLCGAADYPERAREAIAEMHRQVGPLKFTRDSLACRGVLVRHLLMPNQLEQTAAIFQWLARLSPDTFVNIMGQYGPDYLVGTSAPNGSQTYSDINRRPTRRELQQARQLACEAGLWRFDP
ncbi:MAG: radical SAM protein [Pirellulaceae bacterium]